MLLVLSSLFVPSDLLSTMIGIVKHYYMARDELFMFVYAIGFRAPDKRLTLITGVTSVAASFCV